jgi:purine-binding chemotaxis protein CheW
MSTMTHNGTASTNRSTVNLCTFRLHEFHIGIDVTMVQEVLNRQDATRIPLVSDVVQGLINLRGEIVTTIDLRRRLGLPPREADEPSMNVVIRSADGPVALTVDQIGDVIDADESLFEFPPPTLSGPHREFVTGVFKLQDSLLLLIDLERVLDPTTIKIRNEVPA